MSKQCPRCGGTGTIPDASDLYSANCRPGDHSDRCNGFVDWEQRTIPCQCGCHKPEPRHPYGPNVEARS